LLLKPVTAGLNVDGNPQMLPQIFSFGEANVTLATIKHRVIWLFNFLTNQDTDMTCRENQAAVIHAISLFSMKLCQVEGITQPITLKDKVGPVFFVQNPKSITKICIKSRHYSCLQNTLNFIGTSHN